MHACDPVPIVVGLRLAALRAAGAPLKYDKTLLKINVIFFDTNILPHFVYFLNLDHYLRIKVISIKVINMT